MTVVLPEYAPENAADAMLHDQTSFIVKQQLFGEPGVIMTDVPYHPDFDKEPEQVVKSEREPAQRATRLASSP